MPLRCNPTLALKRYVLVRACVSEPPQRPCGTKWLQWIKSEWDLWINRGRSLVDWRDGQIDEPLPAEIGSWFALCIPSIPQSVGGKVPSQRVADRRRQEEGGGHPPAWPVPYCLSQAPREELQQQEALRSIPHIQHSFLLSSFNMHQRNSSSSHHAALRSVWSMLCVNLASVLGASLSITCQSLCFYIMWVDIVLGGKYNCIPLYILSILTEVYGFAYSL